MYYKAYKVKLHPNNKQHTKMLNIGFTCITLYNALVNTFSLKDEKHNIKYKYPGGLELRRTFTIVKEHLVSNNEHELNDYGIEIYNYLNNYFNNLRTRNIKYNIYDISNDSLKQTIKDYDKAIKDFFKGGKGYPKYKKVTLSNLSFYVDPIKIKFDDNHVKLEKLTNSMKPNRLKINYVKLAESSYIPSNGVKYYNPRVTYDGISWWISVGVEKKSTNIELSTTNLVDNLGIDMGIKQTTLSNNKIYISINKTRQIKVLEKRKKRLQRSLSRKEKDLTSKSKNYYKTLRKIRRIQIRLTNIRHSHQDKIINYIKKLNPKNIIIEDLNIKQMMKDSHLSEKISNEEFYRFRIKIKELCDKQNINLVIANRFYPSSKMCSVCHKINKGLRLSDRIFKCECGLIIDRDLNASLNLSKYIR